MQYLSREGQIGKGKIYTQVFLGPSLACTAFWRISLTTVNSYTSVCVFLTLVSACWERQRKGYWVKVGHLSIKWAPNRCWVVLCMHIHTEPLETGIWDPQGQILRAAWDACNRFLHSCHMPDILRLWVCAKKLNSITSHAKLCLR